MYESSIACQLLLRCSSGIATQSEGVPEDSGRKEREQGCARRNQ